MPGRCKYPFLFALLLWAGTLFCQTSRFDSLQNNLRSAHEDSTRVNLLNAMAELKRNSDPDTCIYFAEEALTLSAKINYKPGEAAANLWIGTALTNLGEYEEALKKLALAKNLTEELLVVTPALPGHSALLARVYNNTANIHWRKGNYPAALENNYISLKIKIRLHQKQGIADSYNNLGNIYLDMGNYPEALKCQLASLTLRESLENSGGMADSYNNIGNVYYKQGNYNLAGTYYLKSLGIKKLLGDQKGMASAYANLANVYSNQSDYTKAHAAIAEALAINSSLGDKYRIALNHTNAGTIYYDTGNFGKALENHFISLKIREDIGDKEGLMASLNNIALIYIVQNKPTEATRHFKRSLEIANGINSREDLMVTYNGLYQADSLLGNSKAALEHFKLYIQYRDSLFNEENTKKQVQVEMNFAFEKKEAEGRSGQERKDAVAAAERKRQRVILFAISGFGLLVLGFAVYAYRSFLQKRKVNIEISLQKQLIEEKQKEILDSIYYARRIQQSLITREDYIHKCLTKLVKN